MTLRINISGAGVHGKTQATSLPRVCNGYKVEKSDEKKLNASKNVRLDIMLYQPYK